MSDLDPLYARRGHRLFTLLMGLLLVAAGLYALIAPATRDWLSTLAGLAFLGLGIDAILAAARAKGALICRLGPLP